MEVLIMQLDLIPKEEFIFNNAEKSIAEVTNGDVLGCCHLYYECSMQKKCISSYPETASRCAYRKNLERGKILYSPNANNFNNDEFIKVKNNYYNLPNSIQSEFDDYLYYFLKYEYLSSCFICAKTENQKHLIDLGFMIEFEDAVFKCKIIENLLNKILIKMLPTYNNYKQEMTAYNKNKKKCDKKPVKYFICRDIERGDFDDYGIFDKYTVIGLSPSNFKYFIEFFNEIENKKQFNILLRCEDFIKKGISPFSIDKNNNSAEFKEKGNLYKTTLGSCTCSDFKIYRSPCKHMYSLSKLLGKRLLSKQETTLLAEKS
jgi:hypothetical protein